jgi:hypothetical protein
MDMENKFHFQIFCKEELNDVVTVTGTDLEQIETLEHKLDK